jgi:hypothetical protein
LKSLTAQIQKIIAMQYKPLVFLTLVASGAARIVSFEGRTAKLHVRDVASLATIKSTIKTATRDINEVNTGIKALTAGNAKEQLKVVNSALLKLSSGVGAGAKRIRSSGSVGIGEVMGLLGDAGRNELSGLIGGLTTALNTTSIEIGAKREILKASGAVNVVVPGIKSLKQPLVDIVALVPSQIPAIAKGAINGFIAQASAGAAQGAPGSSETTAAAPQAGPAAPKGKGAKGVPKSPAPGGTVTIDNIITPQVLENVSKSVDGLLDRLIGYLNGTHDTLLPPTAAKTGSSPPVKASLPNSTAAKQLILL